MDKRVARAGGTCIYKLTALAAKLGHPAAILCLGNGPSSEDPTVKNRQFTVHFRVNYQWKNRDFARKPAVIFTADPDLPENTDSILAFPTREDANRILLDHCRKGRPPKAGYFVFPELLHTGIWPSRPTNGALMIATAVALKPKKLVIAGIDLYLHPAGKYPEDVGETNDYDAIHSRATDIDFIRLALQGFGGELLIVGDELRRAVT